MKKFLFRGLLVLVGLVIVLVIVLYFTINTIAAREIESAATDALGVETTVGAVRISLFEGRTEILDLDITNPTGYDGEFLVLGDGVVGLNLGSLLSERVEVKEFTLKDIKLSLIQRADGSNVGAILDNINKGSSDKPSDDAPKDDSDPQKFIIDRLEVDNVQIAISVQPISDATKPSTVTIKQIVIEDIGRKENGVTMDKVSQIIVQSILKSALEAAPTQIPSIMLSAMRGGLSNLDHLDLGGVQVNLGKGLSTILGDLGKATGSGGKSVDDTLKDIGKSIGDLLKPGSDEEGDTSSE